MSSITAIVNTIKKEYDNLVWTHLIHEKQAIIYQRFNSALKIFAVGLTAISSVGIVSTLFANEFWVKVLTAILSCASLAVTLVNYEFPFTAKVEVQKRHATNLLAFRDAYRLLLAKRDGGFISDEEFLKDYQRLSDGLHELYKQAPLTSDLAVKMAEKRIDSDRREEDAI